MAALSASFKQAIASHSRYTPWYEKGKWTGAQLRAIRAKNGVGRPIKPLNKQPIGGLKLRLAKSIVPTVAYKAPKQNKFWFF